MLPLSLLNVAKNSPILVELKNGETYNGFLESVDNWMNMTLREAVCTSRSADRFWKLREVFVKGVTIKNIRLPNEVMEQALRVSKRMRLANQGQSDGSNTHTDTNSRGEHPTRGSFRGRGAPRGRGNYSNVSRP